MANPFASDSPRGSPDRTTIGLLVVAILFAVGNFSGVWLAQDLDGMALGFGFIGALVFEPIALGIWTAIGRGSLLTRLPVALPVFAFACIALGIAPTITRMEKYEFTGMAGVGFAVFTVTALLFLIFRRFIRIQLQPVSSNPIETIGFSFSIKSMLLLTTAYAIVMGLASQLTFRSTPPSTGPVMFGPSAVVEIMALIGGVVFACVLPTLLVPFSILQGHLSRTALAASIILWLITTTTFTLIFDGPGPKEILLSLLSAQVGALTAGTLTALLLRFAGLRMVRYPSGISDALKK